MKRVLRLAVLEGSVPAASCGARREFHVSLDSRRRYQFNQALFSLSGNVVLADYQAVRVFALKMNEGRGADAAASPVRAGALNAMGLIDEILHHVAALYAAQVRPGAFRELLAELEKKAGAGEARRALLRFCRDFPPLDLQQGRISPEEYLLGTVQGVPNREVVLEEMLLLWLANANPAFAPFRELFADSELSRDTAYALLPGLAREFFAALPPFGPDGQNLVDMLRSPAQAYPDSLAGQLRYIREKWGLLLGRFLERLLIGGDLIREDEKSFPPGAGPAAVFDPAQAERQERREGGEEAAERFSPDREWMPRLVLMAKTVYVWLDQLSRAYGRPIATLDAIPDEELDRLAGWGFTGLWLIGVWERSPASRRIKQACGNPEAMASAYSLYRYEIAADLGGEAALENLRSRAWARGIRLASDMVPNHMGIDSPWVIEHPEWFISLDHSPFPSYRFSGEDLSNDPRVGIYLEDHYYDRSDAAVVFKWVDRRSGRERYIYHGNDGTRMPWNDTAQLNYLRPDVREAVMQAILGVARLFPVIRFDAAMTLARRHYQRLWYPPPGAGGDIPSRAGMGMTPEQFRQLMPWEFWREVVDRMAREAPDTLLLAEAFWLMESYFVRTLGMHRVYNSAFMNFLKMEENAKFRQSLKNALEFNPEILRRFVNFMNNPDEDTAWAQFGGGDKYFGACTLLAALPGLPMFGHGQVEGFREKYGMEYRRAYLDERPDEEFVRCHERRIFPLLRRRALFAGVDHFRLYDFFAADGRVDENVIAFSSLEGDERGLVVFHNRFASVAGWIRVSAAFAAEDPFGGPRVLRQEELGKGLGLSGATGRFVVFRDLASGLSYLRASNEVCEKGLYLELGAYQAHAFLDIQERSDGADGRLGKLAAFLQGRGVPSLEDADREMALPGLHEALRGLCRPEIAGRFLDVIVPRAGGVEETAFWLEIEERAGRIGAAVAAARPGTDARAVAEAIVAGLLEYRGSAPPAPAGGAEAGENRPEGPDARQEESRAWRPLLAAGLRAVTAGRDGIWDDLRLDAAVTGALRDQGMAEDAAVAETPMARFFCESTARIAAFAGEAPAAGEEAAKGMAKLVLALLEEPQLAEILKVNSFQGETFFSMEEFDAFTERLREALEWEFRRTHARDGAAADAGAISAMELLDFIPSLARQAKFKFNILKKLLLEFSEA
ncbi:MAG TPA: alpha-amylase family glycosyl hydrolase [Candidatus Aminicenantes bacterium]|nr:alpha-amylase family glycosyl hydrolase [Candidatus Aminicenantes bacterium]